MSSASPRDDNAEDHLDADKATRQAGQAKVEANAGGHGTGS
jgi:hypothetical protein